MNREIRNSILRGISGATDTHDSLGARERHADGLNSIDVFEVINDLGLPIAFQALDKLLGACVRVSSTEVGILVTTQRDIHMQRFTAAHELGHFILEHEGSLDDEVRMPGHTERRDPREIEADAFAAEFLMPKWLVKSVAMRRKWWAEASLCNPEVVYQLALRLAVSYEATCWALASHDFIKRSAAVELTAIKLKDMKKKMLQEMAITDPWADVWLLGSGDNGAQLEAGPNDFFIIEMDEHPSMGLRWEIQQAIDVGFDLLENKRASVEGVIGGLDRRRLVLRAPPPGTYNLCLPRRHLWGCTELPSSGTGAFRLSVSTVGARRGNTVAESAVLATVH